LRKGETKKEKTLMMKGKKVFLPVFKKTFFLPLQERPQQ